MRLTAKAWLKNTRKGVHDVIDVELKDAAVLPEGSGLVIRAKTKRLSLSGDFEAKLYLEWDEIELLAKTAARVPPERRLALLEAEVDRLQKLIDRNRAGE